MDTTATRRQLPCSVPWVSSGGSSTPFADAAAAFAAELRLEHVPESVLSNVEATVTDTIGVTLAGLADPVMADLALRLADEATVPTAPLLGSSRRTDPNLSAFVHGTAGVWHDFDAGNRYAGGHPAVHCIPAAMAAAGGRSVSGRLFLEAVLAGYEIAARIGRGTNLRPGMHPHGTWGTVGAAVSAGLIQGFDVDGIREVINVSSSLTIASSWQAAFEGATVRNAFAGAGAASGVLAAELVAAGFTGERDGVATVFGGLSGTDWDPTTALAELGNRWEIDHGYVKLLASARYLHPALDAIDDALDGADIRARDIEDIEVRTFGFAATMDQVDPPNPLAAKFSLPHAAAAQIVLGNGGIDAFTDEALANPEIRDLAGRVGVEEDPAMSARTPSERPAAVTVRLRDGSVLTAERSLPRGDDGPIPDDAVRRKFMDCATRLIDPSRADDLLGGLTSLATLDDVDSLW